MRAAVVALALGALSAIQPPAATQPVTWRLNNLSQFAADKAEVIGAPAVVATELGPAVKFNGASDGLLIARNPIAGLTRFTIEVLLSPELVSPVSAFAIATPPTVSPIPAIAPATPVRTIVARSIVSSSMCVVLSDTTNLTTAAVPRLCPREASAG